jgi:hypothetical protein
MPAFTHDDRFVDPDEVRQPNVAAVLLVDLGVEQAPKGEQRRAVARWIETHQASPALATSLGLAGLLPARGVKRSVRRPRPKGYLRTVVAPRIGDVVEVGHRGPGGRAEVTVGVVTSVRPQPGGRSSLVVRPRDGGGSVRTFRVPSTQVGRLRVLERATQ